MTAGQHTDFTSLRLEAELIEKTVRGDRQSFHDLVHPYRHQVLRIASNILPNRADAEDAVQEALISAFRNLHKFRGESKFGTWLTSITINQAKMRLRRNVRHQFVSIDEMPTQDTQLSRRLELAQTGTSPIDNVELDEIRSILWKAMQRLAQPYRRVLVLQAYNGLSMESVAGVLGISVAATKSRLYRARKVLQKQMNTVTSTKRHYISGPIRFRQDQIDTKVPLVAVD